LRCGVEGNQLVISIGIGTLAWACRKRNGGPLAGRFKVVDELEFARDVANALQHEDEIGDSKLCELLDEAMQEAADRGSCGLEYPL
jgi:hypothetical protein